MCRFIPLILALILFAFSVNGQPFTLKKSVDIDTLRLLVELPKWEFTPELELQFQEEIDQFNSRPEKEFILVRESETKGKWLSIEMSPVKYVTTKRNITGVLLNAGIIGGHVLMIGGLGWTLPILPLFPATVSRTKNTVAPELITQKKNTSRSSVSSTGFFRSNEKQTLLFKRAFGRQFLRPVYQLEKHEKKNRKKRINKSV